MVRHRGSIDGRGVAHVVESFHAFVRIVGIRLFVQSFLRDLLPFSFLHDCDAVVFYEPGT